MSQKTDSANHPGLQQLRAALVGRVCTGGIYRVPPEDLGLYYHKANKKEATFINFADATNEELEALSKVCQPATFGRGDEDVFDETYRKAGKLDVNNFLSAFERSCCSEIINTVWAELVDGRKEFSKAISVELYKLNVYDKGAFFKPHKDTPRATNMFASLVIVFPTPHEGGSLVLRHKGQEWTFDSPCTGESEIGYIAFYSDVEHEVLPVTSGYRVTLTYNLYFEPKFKRGLSDDTDDVIDTPCRAALEELLSDSSFLPEGGRLGFGLYHQYPYDSKPSSSNYKSLGNIKKYLKGSDATLYRVCKDLGLDTKFSILYSAPYEDAHVLLSQFIYLDYEGGDIIRVLRDDYGGEVLCDDRYYDGNNNDEDEPEKRRPREFVWATPKTTFNRVKEPYIAYGNEHTLGVLYADICLIVEIDDYASRK